MNGKQQPAPALPCAVEWEQVQALFFDFDGVIVDSVPIKTDAYYKIFEPYGSEAARYAVAYHKRHGGVDRYRKIEHVLSACVLDPGKRDELAQQFADLVVDLVAAAPVNAQVLSLVEEAGKRSCPCFVVSGTPEIELQAIVARKKLTDKFKAVHGSPRRKDEILKSLLSTFGFLPSRCIFVGDAITDFEAAQTTGMFFIGVPESMGVAL